MCWRRQLICTVTTAGYLPRSRDCPPRARRPEGRADGGRTEAAVPFGRDGSAAGPDRRQLCSRNMIVLIGGISGSGKTTVGVLLARRLNWLFADGDSFHPAANIAKMRSRVPLTDADRWPWLQIIGQWMDERIVAGDSAVVPCSMLKRSYRDLLLTGRPAVRLAFLTADRDVLHARLAPQARAFLQRQAAGQPVRRPGTSAAVREGADAGCVLDPGSARRGDRHPPRPGGRTGSARC